MFLIKEGLSEPDENPVLVSLQEQLNDSYLFLSCLVALLTLVTSDPLTRVLNETLCSPAVCESNTVK